MTNVSELLFMLSKSVRDLGITLIVLGLLAVLVPVASGAMVFIVVGIILMVAGLIRAVFGWRARSAGKGPFGLAVVGLTAALGLALVLNPVSGLSTVVALIAIYLVIDGIFGVLFGRRLMPEDGWPWVVGDAVISMSLGVSMWIGWPLSGIRAVGMLIGVKLVSAGAVLIRINRTMQRLHERASALHDRLVDRLGA